MEDSLARSVTPLRCVVELAVLAIYLAFAPQAFESALEWLGFGIAGFVQVAATSGLYLVLFLLAAAMVRLGGDRLSALGLAPPRNIARAALFGILGAALIYVVVRLLEWSGLTHADPAAVAEFRDRPFLLLTWIGFVVIVAAFVQEFVFRGFVAQRIAGAFEYSGAGWDVALIGQAIFYGIANAYGSVRLGLLAALFGLFYGAMFFIERRNLWAPIVAHAVYDTGRIVLAYWLLTAR